MTPSLAAERTDTGPMVATNEGSRARTKVLRTALGTGFLALALYFLALGVVDAVRWLRRSDNVAACGFAVFGFAAVGGALLFVRTPK